MNGTPDLRHKHTEFDGDGKLSNAIRSDLDDIQQRLRPRELKFDQIGGKYFNAEDAP